MSADVEYDGACKLSGNLNWGKVGDWEKVGRRYLYQPCIETSRSHHKSLDSLPLKMIVQKVLGDRSARLLWGREARRSAWRQMGAPSTPRDMEQKSFKGPRTPLEPCELRPSTSPAVEQAVKSSELKNFFPVVPCLLIIDQILEQCTQHTRQFTKSQKAACLWPWGLQTD